MRRPLAKKKRLRPRAKRDPHRLLSQVLMNQPRSMRSAGIISCIRCHGLATSREHISHLRGAANSQGTCEAPTLETVMRLSIACVTVALSILVHAAPHKDFVPKLKESIVAPRGWTRQGRARPDDTIELRIALPQPNFPLLEQNLYEVRYVHAHPHKSACQSSSLQRSLS